MASDRVWSRLRGRILACIPDGDYERRSRLAEYITNELMAAPELLISEGEWPTDADAMLAADPEAP